MSGVYLLSISNDSSLQPESLEELQIPIEFQRTTKNDVFLLYDSGPQLRRILIFGTQRNVEMLMLARIWLADGTFKTSPILFEQVYVIHALRGGPEPLRDGHLLPSLFVLLTNKIPEIYMKMWEAIQQLCPPGWYISATHISHWNVELSSRSTRRICSGGRGGSSQKNWGGGCKFWMGAVVIMYPRGEAVVSVHFSILMHLNGERQSNTKNVLIYYQLIQIFATHYTDCSMLPKLI